MNMKHLPDAVRLAQTTRPLFDHIETFARAIDQQTPKSRTMRLIMAGEPTFTDLETAPTRFVREL